MPLFHDAESMQDEEGARLVPPDQLSDEALISAIAGGAAWAMEPFYQRYSRMLYSLVYRMVADHHLAQDLTQEAFILVWRRASTYSPQAGTVRNWLFSIVHHRTIDYLRALRRRAHLKEVTLEEIEEDDPTASEDVCEEAWRSVLSSQVRAAMLHIPLEQRMVIELAFFQGWSHTEIATGYNIPLGTVKARMRLGLLHLKRVLDQMGINER